MKRKKRNQKPVVQDIPIVRYQTDKEHGLSEEQLHERIEHHLVNDTKINGNLHLNLYDVFAWCTEVDFNFCTPYFFL